MLTDRHIPQYNQAPVGWNRFLFKAAKGSAKAIDMLSCADMAYMAALIGDPTAPETLQLADYNVTLRDYFATLSKPDSAELIASKIDSSDWFAFKMHGQLSTPKESHCYAALWSRGQTVSARDLLNDSIYQCHTSWSADWLFEMIDNDYSLDFNSLDVVSAMLLLALTWKVS